jgi:hypothetical protein
MDRKSKRLSPVRGISSRLVQIFRKYYTISMVLSLAGTRQNTAHGPRPTAHGPRPTAHGPRPTAHDYTLLKRRRVKYPAPDLLLVYQSNKFSPQVFPKTGKTARLSRLKTRSFTEFLLQIFPSPCNSKATAKGSPFNLKGNIFMANRGKAAPGGPRTYPSALRTYPSASRTYASGSHTYPSASRTYLSASRTYPSGPRTYLRRKSTYSLDKSTYLHDRNSYFHGLRAENNGKKGAMLLYFIFTGESYGS